MIAGVLHLVGSCQVQQWQCCVWSALREHAQALQTARVNVWHGWFATSCRSAGMLGLCMSAMLVYVGVVREWRLCGPTAARPVTTAMWAVVHMRTAQEHVLPHGGRRLCL